MSLNVTVPLSDAVRQRAESWAEQTGMPLSAFLAETIELSLLPLGTAPPPVESWTDEEVIQACDDFFSPDDDRRLSDLLARQREDTIGASEREELRRLMTDYQERLVRKALALEEAVRRGLREPIAS